MWKNPPALGRPQRSPMRRRHGLRGRMGARVLHTCHGAAALELALVLPILLLLFFAVVEFGHEFYARLTIRHAVAEAARFAVTGREIVDPESGKPVGRVESIRRELERHAANLSLAVEDITVDPPDGGGPEQVVTVRASFRYEYWLPGMRHLPGADFTVATSMRNEPFTP